MTENLRDAMCEICGGNDVAERPNRECKGRGQRLLDTLWNRSLGQEEVVERGVISNMLDSSVSNALILGISYEKNRK